VGVTARRDGGVKNREGILVRLYLGVTPAFGNIFCLHPYDASRHWSHFSFAAISDYSRLFCIFRKQWSYAINGGGGFLITQFTSGYHPFLLSPRKIRFNFGNLLITRILSLPRESLVLFSQSGVEAPDNFHGESATSGFVTSKLRRFKFSSVSECAIPVFSFLSPQYTTSFHLLFSNILRNGK
jgi:hypothetical protein